MAYNAKQIVDALRDAQILSMRHRTRTYVIAYGRGLKAVTRVNKDDVVVIDGIVPAMEGVGISTIARQALEEFPDAIPALDRVIDIITKDNGGNPRSPQLRAEILDAFISAYEWGEMNTVFKKAQECCFTNPRPNKHESFWFRLLGLRS